MPTPFLSSRSGKLLPADILFAVLSLLFSVAACKGTLLLTPLGAGMDSDLQNYAQILEVARHPAPFAADPLAPFFAHDPGVPNLLTNVANLFFSDSANAAVSILKAGGIALWLHLLSWYALGRFLWSRASLAVVLSVVSSITFYWAFGTFWGATHSDPIPRIFFNSCFALFVALALAALKQYRVRALLAALLGLSIFIHSVSALMSGAMFLTSFLLLPCEEARDADGSIRWGRHVLQTFGCLLLYLLPVACFMAWRVPIAMPQGEDLALLVQAFKLRFAKDYHDIWGSLAAYLWQYTVQTPLLPLGLLSLLLLFRKKDLLPAKIRSLPNILLTLACGIAVGCLACVVEIQLSHALGRQPLSPEMLRGTRFLIPLCLLGLTCALSLVWNRLPRALAASLVVAGSLAVFLVSPDKQVMAARYALTTFCSLEPEKMALQELGRNTLTLEAMQAIADFVPQNESVFAPDDTMAVRYIARHPLQPVHKDGNIIYYTRNLELAKKWVWEQARLTANPDNVLDVWLVSEAKWLLVRKTGPFWAAVQHNQARFHLAYTNADWQLLRKP